DCPLAAAAPRRTRRSSSLQGRGRSGPHPNNDGPAQHQGCPPNFETKEGPLSTQRRCAPPDIPNFATASTPSDSVACWLSCALPREHPRVRASHETLPPHRPHLNSHPVLHEWPSSVDEERTNADSSSFRSQPDVRFRP